MVMWRRGEGRFNSFLLVMGKNYKRELVSANHKRELVSANHKRELRTVSWSRLIICSEQTEMSVSKSSKHLVSSKGEAGWEKYTEFRQQHKCSGDQQVGPFSQYPPLGIQ